MVAVLEFGREVLMVHANVVVGVNKRHNLAALRQRLENQRPGLRAEVVDEFIHENLVGHVGIVGRAAPDQVPNPFALDHPFVEMVIGAGIVVQVVGAGHVGFHRLHGKADAIAKLAATHRSPGKFGRAPVKNTMRAVGANLPDDGVVLRLVGVVLEGAAGRIFAAAQRSLIGQAELLAVVLGLDVEVIFRGGGKLAHFLRVGDPGAHINFPRRWKFGQSRHVGFLIEIFWLAGLSYAEAEHPKSGKLLEKAEYRFAGVINEPRAFQVLVAAHPPSVHPHPPARLPGSDGRRRFIVHVADFNASVGRHLDDLAEAGQILGGPLGAHAYFGKIGQAEEIRKAIGEANRDRVAKTMDIQKVVAVAGHDVQIFLPIVVGPECAVGIVHILHGQEHVHAADFEVRRLAVRLDAGGPVSSPLQRQFAPLNSNSPYIAPVASLPST